MSDTTIEKEVHILRAILGELAKKNLNKEIDFIEEVRNYFCFQNSDSWAQFLNACYVLEDTELAKSYYRRNGFQKGHEEDAIGYNYLILYGLLNAVYQQKWALISLVELFKIPNKKDIVHQLSETQAIHLRNKIASHSSNYKSIDDNMINVYTVSRHLISTKKLRLERDQTIIENYDLDELLNEFDKYVEKYLFQLLEKFIKKKFQNKGSYYEQLVNLKNSIA